MWDDLPLDLLSHIFSFLQPDSLACARSTCWNWHQCPVGYLDPSESSRRRRQLKHSAWFITVIIRDGVIVCYAQNPIDHRRQYVVRLDFIPSPIQPVSAIGNGGHILLRSTSDSVIQLSTCNPFTREFRALPSLNVPGIKLAAAVLEELSTVSAESQFRVYVVVGLSGANDSTVEMYDSLSDSWIIVGQVPMEYAVRLTVSNPDEGVYCDGVIYWMTSAGWYSLIGFEISTNEWRELSLPIADRLEFAALWRRNGKLMLVGGKCGGDAYVWEHGIGSMIWGIIEKVPFELGMKFLRGKGCWDNTKCVCTDGMVCLFKDVGSGMLAWREIDEDGRWEWNWIDGCCSIRGQQEELQNFQIKGLLLHPNLAHSSHFNP